MIALDRQLKWEMSVFNVTQFARRAQELALLVLPVRLILICLMKLAWSNVRRVIHPFKVDANWLWNLLSVHQIALLLI